MRSSAGSPRPPYRHAGPGLPPLSWTPELSRRLTARRGWCSCRGRIRGSSGRALSRLPGRASVRLRRSLGGSPVLCHALHVDAPRTRSTSRLTPGHARCSPRCDNGLRDVEIGCLNPPGRTCSAQARSLPSVWPACSTHSSGTPLRLIAAPSAARHPVRARGGRRRDRARGPRRGARGRHQWARRAGRRRRPCDHGLTSDRQRDPPRRRYRRRMISPARSSALCSAPGLGAVEQDRRVQVAVSGVEDARHRQPARAHSSAGRA